MSVFDVESAPVASHREPIPLSDIDMALTSQLVVAWAGETGEEHRLGWWRCDLASEYGGEDLFRRLLPSTWRWATLQGAREAARRVDAELRRHDHEPDRIVSLFSLGFELDERIEERLADLKRSGRTPDEALPGLAITHDGWHPDSFWDWVAGHGEAGGTAFPAGRRLSGSLPATVGQQARRLVAGLAPATERYPLPHFRRAL
ncbi:BREX-6 system BrxE protein [Microtetraspora sp. AC03309]|uniref:BREX-6 system BrxE protein n=1 Tax=Microtetraspora sp. AC03309 TaxID=2779376 RepID=UPI001E62B810|nr:BREX-6 system BrxE protein [Microtetraspora sp. AC03309]MCC5578215.1 BREX-6 system BrxE protein [Microtetraspora sp. AC03309]